MTTEDTYEISGTILLCHSKSGTTYKLTNQTCNCRGFGFRKTCRHYQNAYKLGWLKRLSESIAKQPRLSRTPHIIEARKKSIQFFLTKHNIRLSAKQIEAIEPSVRRNMTVDKFLSIVHRAGRNVR
jgi:hypothetical protein